MKQVKLQIFIILMLGFGFRIENVKAQDLSETKNSGKLYEYFGCRYPLDDELVNGFLYNFRDKRIKNTPFLNGSVWENAVIYVKGKKYINIPCKYDLIIDRFIVKIEYNELDKRIISVNKFQIDSVLINNLMFINSDNVESNTKIKNYYEQIYKGDISLYKIYNIRFIDMYSNADPYGKFSLLRDKLYLLKNKELIKIKSKKSFVNCFKKSNKEKLLNYIHTHSINFAKSSNSELVKLMIYCNTLINS